MSKLRVKCIRCGVEWEKESVVDWGPSDCSSSLCTACFVAVVSPLIHKKQRLEGNFDCFGKAGCFCDQADCKYRQWCLAKGHQTADADVHRKGEGTRPAYSDTPEMHPNSHP